MKQCSMVKAEGTGTRCMVYRNNELALQWQETSRAVMTEEYTNQGWFLRFKNQSTCDTAAPCSTAAFHNILNQSAPLIKCNKTAPVAAPNCAYCCNFTGRAYNEPIGGAWPPAPGSGRKQPSLFLFSSFVSSFFLHLIPVSYCCCGMISDTLG